jgi:hypothetical protein
VEIKAISWTQDQCQSIYPGNGNGYAHCWRKSNRGKLSAFRDAGLGKEIFSDRISGVSDNLLTDALACTALLLQCTEPGPRRECRLRSTDSSALSDRAVSAGQSEDIVRLLDRRKKEPAPLCKTTLDELKVFVGFIFAPNRNNYLTDAPDLD